MSTCSSLRQYRNRRSQRLLRSNLIVFLLIVSSLGWFFWDWQQSTNKVESLIFHPQVVQTGDTLWSLAENSGLNIDTRTLVLKMMDYNHLPDSTIRTGQVIYTPAARNHP
jgi:hypothetical protein